MTAPNRVIGLFLGVDRYVAGSVLRDLRFCSNDVMIMRETFESILKVEVFAYRAGRVLYSEVRDDIGRIADLGLGSADTVFLHFAGYGYTRGANDFLVFSESNPGDDSGCMAVRDLLTYLRQSGAGTILLILDCRHKVPRSLGIVPFQVSVPTLDNAYDALIFLGSSFAQYSQGADELGGHGMGVFARAVCNVITDTYGMTFSDFEEEVQREMEMICKTYSLLPQTPQLLGSRSLRLRSIFNVRRSSLALERKRVIIVSGPPDVGKSSLGSLLRAQYGLAHIEMSSFVRRRYDAYVRSAGANISLHDFVENVLWREEGVDVAARAALEELQQTTGDAVITGPRRPEEVAALTEAGMEYLLIYLDADTTVRWSRRVLSGEVDVAAKRQMFLDRDRRESGWGLTDLSLLEGTEIVTNDGSLNSTLTAVADLRRRWICSDERSTRNK